MDLTIASILALDVGVSGERTVWLWSSVETIGVETIGVSPGKLVLTPSNLPALTGYEGEVVDMAVGVSSIAVVWIITNQYRSVTSTYWMC